MKRSVFRDKKLFIFDVDGTLADAYTAVRKSLNFARRAMGYPPVSYTRVKQSVGRGDEKFIRVFFSPEKASQALRIYRRHHRTTVVKDVRLRPYARKVLILLKKQGKILAVASNRPTAFTRILLAGAGIKEFFDYILCADRAKSLKPSPSIINRIVKRFRVPKTETLYIGDMVIDLETARRSGIDAVFVQGGSDSVSQARAFPARRIIRSLRELVE